MIISKVLLIIANLTEKKDDDLVTKNESLKILIVSSEASPFAKTGGLGDVAGSLPRALNDLGADVRIVLPKYKSIKNEYLQNAQFEGAFSVRLSWRVQRAGVLKVEKEFPAYLVENEYYFGRDGFYGYEDDNERFAFFCRAVIEMLPVIDFIPDIIHCNDWQTGLICVFLKENYQNFPMYRNIKTLFTIHNLQYQGNFGLDTFEMLDLPQGCFGGLEFYGQISYMKAGLCYSDKISTVSPTYAQEIQTAQYGYGMDGILRSRSQSLTGILNGIDFEANDPSEDKRIFVPFDLDHLEKKKENKRLLQQKLGLAPTDAPLFGMITRLADQKGLDLLANVLGYLMKQEIQFVVLGTGEPRYEEMFRSFAARYPEKMSANITFDDVLAQQIYAASDMFLMPSLFEPCGLGQIFSLRYGTVPVVRKTGGLADTITHYNRSTKQGNGFVFEDYLASGLLWAIDQALETYWDFPMDWSQIVKNAMACDFSWFHSAKEYLKLYDDMAEDTLLTQCFS